ncbi:MAG: ribonuclease III [Ruminococcaceae bacterium]|nr:ribonuclease III [Oscillospiraceae bacterium]
MQSVNELSAGTLAFVGDAVYGLLVRQRLAETNRPIGELHRLSVTFVNANSQAEAFKVIEPILTEKEISQYKHGRNLHTNNVPKQSTVAQYHSATGLEALFGYLHLSGQFDRINELFELIWKSTTQNF